MDSDTGRVTRIKPDPEHLVALALSGALPDEQTGGILAAAFGPPARVYGCHNKPRPVAGAVTHQAQDGWQYVDALCAIPYESPRDEPTRIPVMVDIKHVMSTDCRYDKHATDPQCAGCKHIKQGPK